MSELGKVNIQENEKGLNNFLNAFYRILDITYARGNHMPFMNESLSKEVMTRKLLGNEFVKDGREDKKKYSKQRNYFALLRNRTILAILMRNLNASDYKTFWKTIKPFLSDKVTSNKINKEEISAGDCNTFKTFLAL